MSLRWRSDHRIGAGGNTGVISDTDLVDLDGMVWIELFSDVGGQAAGGVGGVSLTWGGSGFVFWLQLGLNGYKKPPHSDGFTLSNTTAVQRDVRVYRPELMPVR